MFGEMLDDDEQELMRGAFERMQKYAAGERTKGFAKPVTTKKVTVTVGPDADEDAAEEEYSLFSDEARRKAQEDIKSASDEMLEDEGKKYLTVRPPFSRR